MGNSRRYDEQIFAKLTKNKPLSLVPTGVFSLAYTFAKIRKDRREITNPYCNDTIKVHICPAIANDALLTPNNKNVIFLPDCQLAGFFHGLAADDSFGAMSDSGQLNASIDAGADNELLNTRHSCKDGKVITRHYNDTILAKGIATRCSNLVLDHGTGCVSLDASVLQANATIAGGDWISSPDVRNSGAAQSEDAGNGSVHAPGRSAQLNLTFDRGTASAALPNGLITPRAVPGAPDVNSAGWDGSAEAEPMGKDRRRGHPHRWPQHNGAIDHNRHGPIRAKGGVPGSSCQTSRIRGPIR